MATRVTLSHAHFIAIVVDCKQSFSNQLRGCTHSAARLERGEINEKRLGEISPNPPPLVRSIFFALGYFARPLDYPERDCLQSTIADPSKDEVAVKKPWRFSQEQKVRAEDFTGDIATNERFREQQNASPTRERPLVGISPCETSVRGYFEASVEVK